MPSYIVPVRCDDGSVAGFPLALDPSVSQQTPMDAAAQQRWLEVLMGRAAPGAEETTYGAPQTTRSGSGAQQPASVPGKTAATRQSPAVTTALPNRDGAAADSYFDQRRAERVQQERDAE